VVALFATAISSRRGYTQAPSEPPVTSPPEGEMGNAAAEEHADGKLPDLTWELIGSAAYLLDIYTNPAPYNPAGYPYTRQQGFNPNFFGGNFSHDGGTWGLTVDLRFGTGAPLLTALAPLKQGYVTWKPCDWSFDLGFFDTIYGAEVVDEWNNVNFSRGALYFVRQPFNHSGVRAKGSVSDTVGLAFIVANGYTGLGGLGGAPLSLTAAPSAGGQVSITPNEQTSVLLGYMVGNDGSGSYDAFGHFIDVIATYTADKVKLVFNGDATIDPNDENTTVLYGASLAASLQASASTRIGGRIEYLDGSSAGPGVLADDYLATITGTLRYAPDEHLVLSFEPRVELAGEAFFPGRDSGELERFWFGFIVGASAHFGN
jgi:hypothetical protein